ncbi:hypothetical protein HRG84_19445 [Flavisolibacter sp. BT320]|nr:hypothetical protein [Flavisolibacter longurius]
MKSLIALIFMGLSLSLSAQEKVYYIKANQEISEVMSFTDVYRYPSFMAGIVSFRDGRTSAAKLNYNYLQGEMDFITSSGDTLSLADEVDIKHVAIGKDTFYYAEGYHEQLASFQTKKLTRRQFVELSDSKKLGAFNQPTYSGANTFGSYANSRTTVKLVIKEDLTLVRKTYYFIGDRNEFYPVNKKNLARVFGKKEKEISSYLDANKIDFKKEEDLQSLFRYLTTVLQ